MYNPSSYFLYFFDFLQMEKKNYKGLNMGLYVEMGPIVLRVIWIKITKK